MIVDLASPLDILLPLIIPIMDVLDFLLLIMGVEVAVGVHVVLTVLLLQVATLQAKWFMGLTENSTCLWELIYF